MTTIHISGLLRRKKEEAQTTKDKRVEGPLKSEKAIGIQIKYHAQILAASS